MDGTDASEEGFGLHDLPGGFHVVQRLEVDSGRGSGRGAVRLRLIDVRPAAVDGGFKRLATVCRGPSSQLVADAVPDALRARSLLDGPVFPQQLIAINDRIWDLD